MPEQPKSLPCAGDRCPLRSWDACPGILIEDKPGHATCNACGCGWLTRTPVPECNACEGPNLDGCDHCCKLCLDGETCPACAPLRSVG